MWRWHFRLQLGETRNKSECSSEANLWSSDFEAIGVSGKGVGAMPFKTTLHLIIPWCHDESWSHPTDWAVLTSSFAPNKRTYISIKAWFKMQIHHDLMFGRALASTIGFRLIPLIICHRLKIVSLVGLIYLTFATNSKLGGNDWLRNVTWKLTGKQNNCERLNFFLLFL